MGMGCELIKLYWRRQHHDGFYALRLTKCVMLTGAAEANKFEKVCFRRAQIFGSADIFRIWQLSCQGRTWKHLYDKLEKNILVAPNDTVQKLAEIQLKTVLLNS